MKISNGLESLNSLIQSQGGIHFTAYLSRQEGAPSVQSQLEEALKVASEDIRSVFTRQERKHFLKPLHSLLLDSRTLATVRGNVGIFRSKGLFRVMHIPVAVEEYATVASSFHVKPLLRWAQEDCHFYLLTVGEKMSSLYFGTQHTLRPLATFASRPAQPKKALSGLSDYLRGAHLNRKQEKLQELVNWIEELKMSDVLRADSPIFIVASGEVREFLGQSLEGRELRFMEESCYRHLPRVLSRIRNHLREEFVLRFQERIYDFEVAEALELTESNVTRISRAARFGLVKKLLVAGDIKIFGKIGPESGNVTFHPADLDHEDEDLLDDIAQAVVKQGGEVLVAPRSRIPGGHSILAIHRPEYPIFSNVFRKSLAS